MTCLQENDYAEAETCTCSEGEVGKKFRWHTNTAARLESNPTYNLRACRAASWKYHLGASSSLWQLFNVARQASTHCLHSHMTMQINSAFMKFCVNMTHYIPNVTLMTGFNNLGCYACAEGVHEIVKSVRVYSMSAVWCIYIYLYISLLSSLQSDSQVLDLLARLHCHLSSLVTQVGEYPRKHSAVTTS